MIVLRWTAAAFAAAMLGCIDTAVVVLEPTDGGSETDTEGDVPVEGTDEGIADDADAGDADDDADGDVPTDDGEAGGCRLGVPGDCPSGRTCDVRSCEAGATGACVESSTPCAADWSPECGCDGRTYWNGCERLAHGIAWSADDACAGGATCLPLLMVCLDAGEVCAWIGCTTATPLTALPCVVRPAACSRGGPVCGCDGTSYDDPCSALDTRLPNSSAGECVVLPDTPVCNTALGGWVDGTGALLCPADCGGCVANCRSLLGWFSFCPADWFSDAGCGGGLLPYQISAEPCGP